MIPALREEHLNELDGIVEDLRRAFAGTSTGPFSEETDPALARALAWLELGLLGAGPGNDHAPIEDDPCPILAELAATLPPAEALDRLRSLVANTDEDPVADEGHLHELLLARYRPERRSGGGVYYTPRELIEATIETAIGACEIGARPENFAAIWDPSAGTGGFLVAMARRVGRSSGPLAGARIIGSEIDPGAVAIGTIRVRQALIKSGALADQARRWCGIRHEDALSDESGPARDVGSLLIVGNPPWANYGRTEERAGKCDPAWLIDALQRYRGDQSERKWQLGDEQIRFLALAEERLSRHPKGALGFVLSRSLLEAPTRAGLRRSLLETFPRLDILDLGGSRFRGREEHFDENVMPVGPGLIVLAASRQGPARRRIARLRGKRRDKLAALGSGFPSLGDWLPLAPAVHACPFAPDRSGADARRTYADFIDIERLFPLSGSGIKTDRDALCVDFDRGRLEERMRRAFAGDIDEDFRAAFKIHDSSSYRLTERLAQGKFDPGAIRPIIYRPLDQRWIYYAEGFTSRPASRIMRCLGKDQPALVLKRQCREGPWNWVCSVRGPAMDGLFAIDNRGRERLYPVFGEDGESLIPQALRSGAEPLEIFHAVLALLSSPAFRTRFGELMRAGPPRIPWPLEPSLLTELAARGREIDEAFALKPGAGTAAFIRLARWSATPKCWPGRLYAEGEELRLGRARLDLPARADAVSLLNCETGGIRPLEKWCKRRRKRAPGAAGMNEFLRVADAIDRILEAMNRIDATLAEHDPAWLR